MDKYNAVDLIIKFFVYFPMDSFKEANKSTCNLGTSRNFSITC